MEQIIHTHNISVSEANAYATTKTSLLKKFFNWCNTQEKYRFFWLSVSIIGLIGAIVPLTLLAVYFFAGNNFILWIFICALNVPILALNLAAQPPKVTLPILLLSLIGDIMIIVGSFAIFIAG